MDRKQVKAGGEKIGLIKTTGKGKIGRERQECSKRDAWSASEKKLDAGILEGEWEGVRPGRKN